MQLIIDTANTRISVRNKAFFIENRSVSRLIGTKRVSSIAITVNCDINASAVKLAARQQIPIYFYNNFGTLQARMCSPFLVNMANLRRKQLYFYDTTEATLWAIDMIEQKTNGQLNLLQQLASRRPKYKKEVLQKSEQIMYLLRQTKDYESRNIDEVRMHLIGIEGSIARLYFQTLRLFIPVPFAFEKRSRRPATDYFNAGLNYLYGMTYSIVESGIYAKGLDPYAGFLHSENYKKPSLVFDLIEPVRPLIDKMWVKLILQGGLNEKHFITKEQGYWLSKEGKRIIIPSFNEYLKKRFKMNGKYFSLKAYIYALSNELGNRIENSINLEKDDVVSDNI